jgi:protein TonB
MNLSDHILSFLLAVLLHVLGLLVVGSRVLHNAEVAATLPELQVASVELTLAGIAPEAAAAGGAAAAQPAEPESVPPLELPKPDAPPPPPILPDKPSFTEALTPPPVPPPEPVPAPVPEPVPEPVPAPVPATAPRVAAVTPAPATQSPAAAAAARQDAQSQETGATIQPASGGSFGRLDAHPALDRPIRPNYPIGARRRGEEGTVILDVKVTADGRAGTVSQVASSGFAELDRAAERAASQARFKPGSRNGLPVESAARLTIIFRLRDP